MQVAGSLQPCAHVKVNVHADEHWHTPVMQEAEAHSACAPQTAPGTFCVHRRLTPMAVQTLETQSAPVLQGESLGNAAQHKCCWLKSKGT